tara:strand:+ start:114 stop:494 length:381 start_codon:yes stop_codon:yes gene_type:complete
MVNDLNTRAKHLVDTHLVRDDNRDVWQYIRTALEEQCVVLTAHDGTQHHGYKALSKHHSAELSRLTRVATHPRRDGVIPKLEAERDRYRLALEDISTGRYDTDIMNQVVGAETPVASDRAREALDE